MRPVKSHPNFANASVVSMWQRSLALLQADFVEAVSRDTGRSEAESYLYDWMPVESTLSYLRENIERFSAPCELRSGLPAVLGRRHLVERRLPVGEVLIVGTWNFPLSLHLSQILFAVACGNRVTFKSSPYAANVGALFERELPRIFGSDNYKTWKDSDEACLRAVEQGRFQALIFTGGTFAARLYAQAAAQSFTKCVLEASGSEAILAHESAWSRPSATQDLLDHWLWALLHFSGQTCVAPRFWFVPESRLDDTWSQLQNILKTEASFEAFSTRAPLRHEGVQKEFAQWSAFVSDLPEVQTFKPHPVHPAFFARLNSVSHLPQNTPSSFGPGALLVGYRNFLDAVEWIKKSPWSLMTQVYGQDMMEQDWEKLQHLETSIVSLGESIVGVGDPAIPFGGRSLSGLGVTHGLEGLRELTRTQVFMEAKSWPLTPQWVQPRWSSVNDLKKLVPVLQKMKSNPIAGLKSFFESL
jgi:acyl-CoA reductase-like NAD-dependent aldehyde dehydrogenase